MTSLNPNLIKKYFRDQKPPNLKELESKGKKFSDPYFLPNTNSLVGKDENGNWIDYAVSQANINNLEKNFPGCSSGKGSLIFKRISEMDGSWDIFKDKIEMNDISQGGLGDCYFLSAISALSNYPYLIKEKFRTIKYNNIGYYEVILFIDGEWQIVFLDDYFIIDQRFNTFAFSKPNNFELWAILLEKAWAKVNGGYALIIGGLIHEAFQVLTGFPSDIILHNNISDRELFQKILESSNQKTLMGCSSMNGSNSKSIDGIVQGHAYTIAEAKSNGNIDLIRVRNPWGRSEWTGPWSDNSNLWTPELREEFNCVSKDDGIFWIDQPNYMTHFSNTTISYILYGSIIKSIIVDKENLFGCPLFFNIFLEANGKLSINTIFRSRRFNRDIKNLVYPTHMVLAKYNENRDIERIYAVGDSLNGVSLVQDLEKGYYALWVFVDYENSTKTNMKMTVRTACSSQYKIEYKGKDEQSKLLEYMIINYNKNNNVAYKQSSLYYLGNDQTLAGVGIFHSIIINKTPDQSMLIKVIPKTVGVNIIRSCGKEAMEIPPGQGIVIIGTAYGCSSGCGFGFEGFQFIRKDTTFKFDDSHIKEYLSLDVQEENTEKKGLILNAYKYVEKDKLNDLINFGGLNQMEQDNEKRKKEEEEKKKKLIEERKKREEEEKKKIEEEKKRQEEEKKRREMERIQREEERKKKELAEKKRMEEERARIEAQRKADEDARKQQELLAQKQLEEAKRKQEEAIAKQEEEKKREAEAELERINNEKERLRKAREDEERRYQFEKMRQQEEDERIRQYEEDMLRQQEEQRLYEEEEEKKRKEIEAKREQERIIQEESKESRELQKEEDNKPKRKVLKSTKEFLSQYFPDDFNYLLTNFEEKDFFKSDPREWVLMIIPDGEYIGEVKQNTDIPHGRGMFFHEDNNYVHYCYSYNGCIECKHTIKLYGFPEWSSHSNIKNGKKNGPCEIVYSFDPVTKKKKEYLVCNCVNDEIEGLGTMHFADGGEWTGNYTAGKKNGVGYYKIKKGNEMHYSVIEYDNDLLIKEFSIDPINQFDQEVINNIYKKQVEIEKLKKSEVVKPIDELPPEDSATKLKREYYEKINQYMEEELLMMKIYFKLYQKDEKEEDNYHITKISKNGTLYIGNVDSNGNFKGKGVYREDNTIYAGFWNVSDSRFFMIYKNGVIQYKGELKDKKYHGRGTLYKNGALYYKGEFIDGKKQGYGILYSDVKGQFIQAQFENDTLKDGPGKFYYSNGVVYKDIRILHQKVVMGNLENVPYKKTLGKDADDFFTKYSSSFCIIEKLQKIRPREFSKEVDLHWEKLPAPDGVFYGQVDKNEPYGIGAIKYRGNDGLYVGYVKHFLPHEWGTFYNNDMSKRFTGELEYGKKNGYGVEYGFKETYYGDFVGDKRNGTGVIVTDDIIYEGFFVNGKKHGDGCIINKANETMTYVRCNQDNIEIEKKVVNCQATSKEKHERQKATLPREYQKYIDLFEEWIGVYTDPDDIYRDIVFKKEEEGKLYIGEVTSNGMKHGRGVSIDFNSKTYYIGFFVYDKKNGLGEVFRIVDDAHLFRGQFDYGIELGGTYYFYQPKEYKIDGSFTQLGEGEGKYIDRDGMWEGNFYGLLRNGNGTVYNMCMDEDGTATYVLDQKVK